MDVNYVKKILSEMHIDFISVESAELIKTDRLLFSISMPKVTVLESWKKLAAASSALDVWPVIGKWYKDFSLWKESRKSFSAPIEIIQAANSFDLNEWISSEMNNTFSMFDSKSQPLSVKLPLNSEVIRSNKSSNIPLTLVPSASSWQVPAYLGYSIADGPSVVIHTAIMKKWQGQYDAFIMSLNTSTIELQSHKLPVTKELALELAKEYYFYCPDSIAQWAWSLENLARILMTSNLWRLWWD